MSRSVRTAVRTDLDIYTGPAYQAVTYTEWYIPDDVLLQFDIPDDEHWVARNMQRSEINKYIEKSTSSWLFTRILPICKVNEI